MPPAALALPAHAARAALAARDTVPSSTDGMDTEDWALYIWLPGLMTVILGGAVSTFVPLWEYCVLFPSEVRIWKRLARIKPFRWQFAPFMTLFLRYTLVVFAFTNAATQYSTSNTDIQCAVQSVFYCATLILASSCAVLAMAWRTNAVVRGVLQSQRMRRTIQLLLFVLALGNIVCLWTFLIQAQWTGSWSGHAEYGVCTTDATDAPAGGTAVLDQAQFWYYVLSLMFDSFCAITISLALHRLASRSQGFSKLIHQLFFHSVGYFILIILLMLLGIIWLRAQNAFWAATFIQVLQGAIVVRILMSEQEQAQRPHDTGYPSEYADGGGDTSYFPDLTSRGSFFPPGAELRAVESRPGASPLPSQGAGEGKPRLGAHVLGSAKAHQHRIAPSSS